ncbi:MAG: ABC transporter substrate-binding protein [Pseudomonadota bacterium]
MKKYQLQNQLFALALGTLAASTAHAEAGVSSTEIRIGMANALSGPAAALGTGMRQGATVLFNKVNAAGGINGRKIKLVSVDDGYEPAQTAAATEKLIVNESVFALFGYVGTPTSKAALPIATKHGVPFFAPFTGAEFLRSPVDKLVFNVRASYWNETEMQVEHLAKDANINRIGLFIQDDPYGVAGKEGVERALRKSGQKPVAEARYKRNTEDVGAALDTLKATNPEAVVIVGTYGASSAFVKKANAAGFKPKFFNLSFVGTSNFIKASGADGEGTYITQVMPSPDDASMAIVHQYQADMKEAGITSYDYISLEGYVDAAIFVEGLKAAGQDLTRPTLLAALEKLKLNLGGLAVAFTPTDHQGLKKVYLTKVKGGKAVSVPSL